MLIELFYKNLVQFYGFINERTKQAERTHLTD